MEQAEAPSSQRLIAALHNDRGVLNFAHSMMDITVFPHLWAVAQEIQSNTASSEEARTVVRKRFPSTEEVRRIVEGTKDVIKEVLGASSEDMELGFLLVCASADTVENAAVRGQW